MRIAFMIHIYTEDFYKDIKDDVEVRFVTSNHKFERPLPVGNTKSSWYDARLIRKRNNKKVCRIKNKNVLLCKR